MCPMGGRRGHTDVTCLTGCAVPQTAPHQRTRPAARFPGRTDPLSRPPTADHADRSRWQPRGSKRATFGPARNNLPRGPRVPRGPVSSWCRRALAGGGLNTEGRQFPSWTSLEWDRRVRDGGERDRACTCCTNRRPPSRTRSRLRLVRRARGQGDMSSLNSDGFSKWENSTGL